MVPPDSHRLPLIPWYLGSCAEEPYYFRLQDFHLLWCVVPNASANNMVSYSSSYLQFRPHTPHNTTDTTVASFNVSDGLGFAAFARHYWRYRWFTFLSSRYWDISLPSVSSVVPMNSVRSRPAWPGRGCPIRRSPGERLFPPIRRLSQVTTSFIAYWCQGIHRMPFVT